ncbi:ATP-binding cassette domain-containing protein [Streptomyces sp. NPDC058682]|uniref:ATP-binding cassette domain-containing protein n=1 Tax=unclassified Streptomyces TaxID=2593676 RepID=UPI00225A037A|nr:ATP-binding cassette domain-containing protein [Streptomyces sp. NBC_01214]MCX4803076.1 ATP-binding cassette domain-containing protein [Streptomyces sp. NBC_01214]
MDIAISARGLRKRYGDHEALKGVDLDVPAGTVLGLLGPNGAGKTTIVRALTTLIVPDAGQAVVAGYDVTTQPREVRKRIGLTGQYAALDERLTGRENLELIGKLFHVGRKAARSRAQELLEQFELTEAAGRSVSTYSGGMRRRLDLAASLIASPPVLFLDEPTTGLDPASRLVLWEMVREQVRSGVTVLLTTQYLEEADQLADRIMVINKGLTVAEGTSDELKRTVGGERLEITFASADSLPPAAEALQRVGFTSPVTDAENCRLSVALETGLRGIADASNSLQSLGFGLGVVDFSVRKPSLDDVFLELTDRPGEADGVEEAAAEAVSR